MLIFRSPRGGPPPDVLPPPHDCAVPGVCGACEDSGALVHVGQAGHEVQQRPHWLQLSASAAISQDIL